MGLVSIEEKLIGLGIPTEIPAFLASLSQTDLSWDALTSELVRVTGECRSRVRPNDVSMTDFLCTLVEEVFTLPVGVRMSLDFAMPNAEGAISVLKPLKDLSKLMGGFCQSDYPTPLKIKVIRSLIHIYAVAAAIPLGIGALVAMTIFKQALNSALSVLNGSRLSDTELLELQSVLRFPTISFEKVLIGEIGFTYFNQRDKSEPTSLEKWKEVVAENPNLKSHYRKAQLRKLLPIIDSAFQPIYLNGLTQCLSEYRAKGERFQLADMHRIMHVNGLKGSLQAFFYGEITTNIFDRAHTMGLTIEAFNLWFDETIGVALTPAQPMTQNEGSWGNLKTFRQEHLIDSRLVLTLPFFGYREYRILASLANP